MLRSLTLERSQIKEAMGFALDNADAAGEVVEVLTESLTLKETPIPTKVSRLMLVSDILHNSSAPVKNASAYRTKFESSLPDIMESFNDLYRNITGRITAEALKERVLKVLQVWADWFLFSDAYVNGLRATFLRTGNSGLAPFHFLCGDAPEVEQRTSSDDAGDGGKVNPDGALAIGKGAAMKELLSLPLTELERRCRHNGLSMVGGTATMVARLLYLEEAEKQRGHELDEDLKFASHSSSARFPSTQKDSTLSWIGWLLPNGIVKWIMTYNSHKESLYLPPLTNSAPHYKSIDFSSEDKSETILPTSKWAREDDESDDEQKRSSRDLGLTYSSSGSENAGDGLSKIKDAELTTDTSNSAYPESGMTEELRQKLRRLEVALIEYRESLEEQGIKSSDEIESKVEIHWQRLQSEYGLLNFSGDTSTKGYWSGSLYYNNNNILSVTPLVGSGKGSVCADLTPTLGGREVISDRPLAQGKAYIGKLLFAEVGHLWRGERKEIILVKRRSRSGSPPWKSSSRDHDSDREKRREMEGRVEAGRDKSRERRRTR
ncbi:hypothetical protein KY285_033312 [Solanum tuberosum]|nr:hypothetical protein KY285_033312 [Solanum tuberosum]